MKTGQMKAAVLLKTFLSTVLIVIIGMSFFSCEKVNSPTFSKQEGKSHNFPLAKRAELTQKLKDIAKTLAISLKDDSMREILRTEINSSPYVENIVEATNFLSKQVDFKNYGTTNKAKIIDLMNDKFPGKGTGSFKNKYQNLEFGIIDIYFPVKEHRLKWQGDANLLVAANDQIRAKEEGTVLAYDVDGNEKILSAKDIPTTPVLVVCLSEKRKNYLSNQTITPLTSPNIVTSLKKSASVMATNNEETTSADISFSIIQYCMNKNYEGWLDGHNDIYFKYKIHWDGDPADLWYGWRETAVNSIELTKWKACNYPIVMHSTRNFSILIEMWEEDAMSDEFVADEYWQDCRSLERYPNGSLTGRYRLIGDKHNIYYGPYAPEVWDYWELRDGIINSNDCDQIQIAWSQYNRY